MLTIETIIGFVSRFAVLVKERVILADFMIIWTTCTNLEANFTLIQYIYLKNNLYVQIIYTVSTESNA